VRAPARARELIARRGCACDSCYLAAGYVNTDQCDSGLVRSAFGELRRKAAEARERSGPPKLALVADGALSWDLVGPFVHTAGRAGFEIDLYGLAPTPLQPIEEVPLLAASAAPAAELRLDEATLVVRCGADERAVELAALAGALKRCGAEQVSLSAAPETSWRPVAAVAGALAGQARIVVLTDFAASPPAGQ
jgi:hypothetical protein